METTLKAKHPPAARVPETAQELLQHACRYLLSLGMNEREAWATLDSLLYAERRGKTTHGLNRLFSGFVRDCLEKRLMEPNRVPTLLPQSDHQRLFFDGNFAIGYSGIQLVIDRLLTEHADQSVLFCHIKNLYPTNALSEYAERLCDAGYIAFIVSKSPAKVVPPVDFDKRILRIKPVVGTNAYAWGFPCVGGRHVVFDTSMASATNGDLLKPMETLRKEFDPTSFLTRELQIPEDPAELFDERGAFNGMILPLGGRKNHKGFGNLLVAELFNLVQDGNRTDTSTAIIAIKADVKGLRERGSRFRKRYYDALVYADGSNGKLPHDPPLAADDAEILDAAKQKIAALPTEGAIETGLRMPAISLREGSLDDLKWSLIQSVKRIVLERAPAVPEFAIDQALETDLDNSAFFEDWGKNTQYQLPSLDDHQRIMRGIAAAAGFAPTDRVLDIGCGNGRLIDYLEAVDTLVCLDVSASMLESVRNKPQIAAKRLECVQADYLDYTPDAPFDKIVAVMSMHHLPHDQKQAGLDKIAAQLKDGGCFLMGETFLDSGNLADRENLLNIADIYCRKIINCFSRNVLSHGLKDFQILRRILFANGEYMVSRNQWIEHFRAAGLEIVTSAVTTPAIGYGYVVGRKIGKE